jgi:hypothetical protein
MAIVKFIASIAIVGSIAWVIADPGFESVLAVFGSLSTLVSAFIVEKRNINRSQHKMSVSKSSIGVQDSKDVSLENVRGDKYINNNQDQNVSENGTAIQAGGNVNITKTGLSFTEVKDVALEVFRANFYQLAGVAKEVAKTRAEEITEVFLSKLQKEYPIGLDKSNDPDFQYALFTAQKEYARNGDKELGDLLVDLLVDRSKQEQRDILQIVLNESLNTAPKLTESQLAALSIVFYLKYTQPIGNSEEHSISDIFDKIIIPFSKKVVKNVACYQHLEFTGCGAIGIGERNLEPLLSNSRHGQFLKGFDEKEVNIRGISIGLDPRFFIPCLNDSSRMQIRAINKRSLEKDFEEYAIVPEDRAKIRSLFEVGKMSESEIKAKCIEIRPKMSELFEIWSNSAIKHFTLTSVGIAIGHANIKRLIGEFSDLSIWIN